MKALGSVPDVACPSCNEDSTLARLVQRSRARRTPVQDARLLLELPDPCPDLSAEVCKVGEIVREACDIRASLCAAHSRPAVPAHANPALSHAPPSVMRQLEASVTSVLYARLDGCRSEDRAWHMRNLARNLDEHKRRWLESHGYLHDDQPDSFH